MEINSCPPTFSSHSYSSRTTRLVLNLDTDLIHSYKAISIMCKEPVIIICLPSVQGRGNLCCPNLLLPILVKWPWPSKFISA